MASQVSVGIDVTSILYNRGVSRYTSNIVRALADLDDAPKLHLFGSSFRANRSLKTAISALQKESEIATKATVLAFPPAFLARMWYSVGRLHIESLMPKVDVFHAWEELIPPSYKTPVVATIHDLALFKFSEIAHPQTRERHTAALNRLLQYKAHVIAVSQQTKRDLMELFSFDDDHVHVIPEALPTESIVEKDTLLKFEDLKKYHVMKPYFLWVGVNEPRKNLDRIIESWRSFSKDYDLVLVGSAGLQSVKPEQGIHVMNSVTKVELASLYANATALVFASLYEGFGLPILEAFYYGCPVVTSNNSGMSEVGDDAASLVDPYDITSIKHGINEAIKHGKSANAQKKMKQRLQAFKWSTSAKETLAVYRLAIQEKA